MAKKLNRKEVWEHLIEAETNERYFGIVSDVCRYWNTFAKLLLILAAIGSLAAVIAESHHQLWLAWLSFAAALIEVVIKPIADWEKVGERANQWRIKWIDVREMMRDLWRQVAAKDSEELINADKVLKETIAIEKERGYVPKVQWVVDRIARGIEKRLGS
jgi:hypothetical protein